MPKHLICIFTRFSYRTNRTRLAIKIKIPILFCIALDFHYLCYRNEWVQSNI